MKRKNLIITIVSVIVVLFIVFVSGVYFVIKNMEKMKNEQAELLKNAEIFQDIETLEAKLQDSDYYDSIEKALLMSNKTNEINYKKQIDQIIFQNETEDYISIFYISEKDFNYSCTSSAKFRKKEFDGVTKYAYLKQLSDAEVHKNAPVIGTFEEALPDMFLSSDLWNHVMNADSNNTRMITGATKDERVYHLKVEGMEPTGIIPYDDFGETWYFFYFKDMPTTKSWDELEFTLN